MNPRKIKKSNEEYSPSRNKGHNRSKLGPKIKETTATKPTSSNKVHKTNNSKSKINLLPEHDIETIHTEDDDTNYYDSKHQPNSQPKKYLGDRLEGFLKIIYDTISLSKFNPILEVFKYNKITQECYLERIIELINV